MGRFSNFALRDEIAALHRIAVRNKRSGRE